MRRTTCPRPWCCSTRVTSPGTRPSRTTFQFNDREVNFSILAEQLNLFHREFYEPKLPAGWTREVNRAESAPMPPQDSAVGSVPAQDARLPRGVNQRRTDPSDRTRHCVGRYGPSLTAASPLRVATSYNCPKSSSDRRLGVAGHENRHPLQHPGVVTESLYVTTHGQSQGGDVMYKSRIAALVLIGLSPCCCWPPTTSNRRSRQPHRPRVARPRRRRRPYWSRCRCRCPAPPIRG